MNPHTLNIVIPAAVILPVLYFRLRRMLKPQRLKLNRLWIRPAIMLAVVIVVLAASPPQSSDVAWLVLAAAAGLAGGWYWGKLTPLHLHPEDGTLVSSGSLAGAIVLLVLVAFRLGMRAGVGLEAAALHLDVRRITDVSITFTGSLFAARGLEIFLRARNLMKARS